MSVESDLLTGLAELIAAGVPEVVWRPAGAYAPTEVGVVIDDLPDAPAGCVALSAYPVADDVSLSDSVVGVQVRTRRDGLDPSPSRDTDAAIFDVLHGWSGTAGGVRVVTLTRQSGGSLGRDTNGRWGRVSNYYALIHRPSPHRT